MSSKVEALIKENKKLKKELNIAEMCTDSALHMCDHYYEYIEKLYALVSPARRCRLGIDAYEELSKAINELDKYEKGDIDEG